MPGSLKRAFPQGLIAAGLMFLGGPALSDGACQPDQDFAGARYTICSFGIANTDLRLFWRDGAKEPYRTFSAVAEALPGGAVLAFAMNAGMYQEDFRPVGLYVEDGEQLHAANTSAGPAGVDPAPNFYKQPNGVFYFGDGTAGVTTTERFLQGRLKPRYATQSGPMLVIDGTINPLFIEGSRDRTRRTGVCVAPGGLVTIAISEASVNFRDFASLFRDGLGCRDALFLDGGNGVGLYAPALRRDDRSWHGGFGPMVGVVE